MSRSRPRWVALLAGLLACGTPAPADAPPPSVAASSSASWHSPAGLHLAQATASARVDAPFADGEQAFAAVRGALARRYGGQAVTEDELYRAATEGMLEHIDARRSAWNKLLSPDEVRALSDDLQGEFVGIGVEIHFDGVSGNTNVMGVIPGSPAEAVGLTAGDTIVEIDGKLYKGRTQAEVLAQIRGKAGEAVTLTVLRDGRLLPISITRQLITYEVVEHATLPSAVGYVRISSFNAKTAAAVEAALDALAKGGARSLVVDLRGNQGGGFEDGIATANALLPAGTPIVRLVRKGGAEELFVAKTGATRLASAPVAVIIDGETASGGEFLAAALQQGRKAEVVGEKSVGKWSLQTVEDLPNGYAVKYTIGVLRAPAGESYDGVGLMPGVEVHLDRATYALAERTKDWTERLVVDAPLRTAAHLLGAR